MKTIEKAAFVYRWRNLQTRQWYIGYHVGTADDGYICSSSLARPIIESESGWTRKILRCGTKMQMVALEHRILKRLDARRNPRSLNRSNGGRDLAPVSRWEILGYNLDKISDAKEIARLYKQELDGGHRERICIFDCWLIKKVVK